MVLHPSICTTECCFEFARYNGIRRWKVEGNYHDVLSLSLIWWQCDEIFLFFGAPLLGETVRPSYHGS